MSTAPNYTDQFTRGVVLTKNTVEAYLEKTKNRFYLSNKSDLIALGQVNYILLKYMPQVNISH